MAATTVNGTDFCLFITSGATKKCIALATSCKLSTSMATRKTNSKDSGKWDENAVGRMNWTVDSDNMLTTDVITASGFTYRDLLSLYIDRTSVTVSLGAVTTIGAYPQTLSTAYYSGTGIISKLDLNLPDDETATFSISILGTGALSIV